MRGPWEDAVGATTPAVRRDRAAALTRLLLGWRWRVEAWGTGYVVRAALGPCPPAAGIDDVVARAAAARPDRVVALAGALVGERRDAAEAVVGASVEAFVRGGARLSGPEVAAPQRVLAHRDRPVELAAHGGPWRVASLTTPTRAGDVRDLGGAPTQ